MTETGPDFMMTKDVATEAVQVDVDQEPGQIAERLESMERICASLVGQVKHMETRLAPVLRPTPTNPELVGRVDETNRAPMAVRMDTIIGKLRNVGELYANIDSRLEL